MAIIVHGAAAPSVRARRTASRQVLERCNTFHFISCGRFPHFVIGAWEWACGEGDCLESTSLAERLEPAFGSAA